MLRFILCHFASTPVDLILDQDELVMGEEATGKVIVKGSGKERKINGITVRLRLFANGNWYSRYVSEIPITGEFELKAGEEKEFPFSFECPTDILFFILTHYRFETGMDVEKAINPLDKDWIVVRPPKMIQHFLKAMEQMGYRLTSTSVQCNSLINFKNEKQLLWFTGPDFAKLRMAWCPKELSLQKISGFFNWEKPTNSIKTDFMDTNETWGTYCFTIEELETREAALEAVRRFFHQHEPQVQKSEKAMHGRTSSEKTQCRSGLSAETAYESPFFHLSYQIHLCHLFGGHLLCLLDKADAERVDPQRQLNRLEVAGAVVSRMSRYRLAHQ